MSSRWNRQHSVEARYGDFDVIRCASIQGPASLLVLPAYAQFFSSVADGRDIDDMINWGTTGAATSPALLAQPLTDSVFSVNVAGTYKIEYALVTGGDSVQLYINGAPVALSIVDCNNSPTQKVGCYITPSSLAVSDTVSVHSDDDLDTDYAWLLFTRLSD
jgi:hypothetical protein